MNMKTRVEKARLLGERIMLNEREWGDVMAEIESQYTPREIQDACNYVLFSRKFESMYEPITKAVVADSALDFLEPQKVLDFYRWACVMMTLSESKVREHYGSSAAVDDNGKKPVITIAK